MKVLLHLLSIILVLPSVVLASAFAILGHAIATGSLLGFLGDLLAVALWLVPWGLLAVLVALLALVLGGLWVRFRFTCKARLRLTKLSRFAGALFHYHSSSPLRSAQ